MVTIGYRVKRGTGGTMNRQRQVIQDMGITDEFLMFFAFNPEVVPSGEFVSTTEIAAMLSTDPRRVGDLMAQLGVTRSQRHGYRLDELAAVAGKVIDLLM